MFKVEILRHKQSLKIPKITYTNKIGFKYSQKNWVQLSSPPLLHVPRLPPSPHFLAAAQQSVCLWGSWESTFLCSWESSLVPLPIFATIAVILKSVLIWLEHRPLVFICNHSRMLSVCKSLKPHPLLHNKVKSRNSRHQTPDTRLEVKFKSVLRIIMAMTIQSSEVKC